MFISINKGLFDEATTQEINTSLRMFEEKMMNTTVPTIDRTLKTAPLTVLGTYKQNLSVMIENQIVLFVCVPKETKSLSFNESVAPRSRIEARTFNEEGKYGTVEVSTKGNVTLSENDDDVWIYVTWTLAKNSLIK